MYQFQETTTALNLENVIGCFYILAGGFVGGILISLLELTYSSKVDSSRKKVYFVPVVFESNLKLLLY